MSAIDMSSIVTWRKALGGTLNIRRLVAELDQLCPYVSAHDDDTLTKVIERIKQDTAKGIDTPRTELAALVSLSASRFSHWFSEQTGMPRRSYKKWLRMLRGFELLFEASLTEAALGAGFSDQAHFCRTVMSAFGVNPAVIQKLLSGT